MLIVRFLSIFFSVFGRHRLLSLNEERKCPRRRGLALHMEEEGSVRIVPIACFRQEEGSV